MAGFKGWQRGLLAAIGAPATPNNIKFLNAWQRAEGGGASFNPLNTTQPFAGASNYNSVGVKHYRSAQDGIRATAQTLLNGRYGGIVQGLRAGNQSPMALANAEAATPWGTGSLIKTVLGGAVSSDAAPYSGGGVRTTPSHARPDIASVAQTQRPPENLHAYSDFALSLINASKTHSPEAMLGAIMQLRNSLKPQPVTTMTQPTQRPPKNQRPKTPMSENTPAGGGGNPLQEMMRAEQLARQMGLTPAENYNLPGGVHPVHVKTSYHYRKFPGTKVGEAIDVTGNPLQMMKYAKKMLALGGTSELFYDPLGGYKFGKSIGAIGGHGTHVHVAY